MKNVLFDGDGSKEVVVGISNATSIPGMLTTEEVILREPAVSEQATQQENSQVTDSPVSKKENQPASPANGLKRAFRPSGERKSRFGIALAVPFPNDTPTGFWAKFWARFLFFERYRYLPSNIAWSLCSLRAVARRK